MKRTFYFLSSVFIVLTIACTPKATTVVETPSTTTEVVKSVEDEKLSPCPKFSDLENSNKITDNYVIYRDYLKTNQIDKAYELWKTVYDVAPAADGKRNTVLTDGIYFMEYYMSQMTDGIKQKEYKTKVFELYDQIDQCYPEGGYVYARKGFDYFYKYPDMATKEEQFNLFKKAIEIDSFEVGDFILNPFSNLLVELHETKKVDDRSAKKYLDFILKRIKDGKAKAKTASERERWDIIESYAPSRLTYFESVKGFYSCDYFLNKYLTEEVLQSDDCSLLAQTLGYLRFADCEETRTKLKQLLEQLKKECSEKSSPTTNGPLTALKEGRYQDAVDGFQERYDKASDPAAKAKMALFIAKIYYGSLKKYATSRKWARNVLTHDPNNGKAYILIGKLYASSGPICGPGRGFDSQIVTWPAIDKWKKAKAVDPSVAAEANKLIARYQQFMPSKSDIFQRSLKVGQSFKVGCWIQETTTVRTPK